MCTKKLNKLVMIIIILLASGGQLRAESPILINCETILDKCDRYVKLLEDERKLLFQVIQDQTQEIDRLSANQPLIPWYHYAVLGLAVGLAGGAVVFSGGIR